MWESERQRGSVGTGAGGVAPTRAARMLARATAGSAQLSDAGVRRRVSRGVSMRFSGAGTARRGRMAAGKGAPARSFAASCCLSGSGRRGRASQPRAREVGAGVGYLMPQQDKLGERSDHCTACARDQTHLGHIRRRSRLSEWVPWRGVSGGGVRSSQGTHWTRRACGRGHGSRTGRRSGRTTRGRA